MAKSPLPASACTARGRGLAEVPGLEVGAATYDSSLAGLSGLRMALGTCGHIVSEDLVFMLEAMKLSTGVGLPKLIESRGMLRGALLRARLRGHMALAGLPPGFQSVSH